MVTVTREQKAIAAWTQAMATAENYAIDPHRHIALLVQAGEQMAALLTPGSAATSPPATVTREQLQSIEWNGWNRDEADTCPACGRDKRRGHNDVCFIAAALASAPPADEDAPFRAACDRIRAVMGWKRDPREIDDLVLEALRPTIPLETFASAPPAAPPEDARDGSVMVRVDAMYVEQMRNGGMAGPFSRIELDESGSEPRLMLTVQSEPTPESVEWWRSVAAGLGVEIRKLKDLAASREPEALPDPIHRKSVRLAARQSDPPGLVALVKERQQILSEYTDGWGKPLAGLAARLEANDAALSAYDLSAPASPARRVCDTCDEVPPKSGERCAECGAIGASPAPMPTIQVGDVVITDSTIQNHRAMVVTEKPQRLSRGTTDRVVAIYRDPLWRRPAPMPTKGDE